MTTELSYVGNQDRYSKCRVNTQLNTIRDAVQPDYLQYHHNACQQLYRPYSNYHTMTTSETLGRSRYDAFQASVKRYYGWFTLQVNYTWSRQGLTSTGAVIMYGSLPNDGVDCTYGVSQLNRAQAFSVAYVFNLPSMKGGNGFVRAR